PPAPPWGARCGSFLFTPAAPPPWGGGGPPAHRRRSLTVPARLLLGKALSVDRRGYSGRIAAGPNWSHLPEDQETRTARTFGLCPRVISQRLSSSSGWARPGGCSTAISGRG